MACSSRSQIQKPSYSPTVTPIATSVSGNAGLVVAVWNTKRLEDAKDEERSRAERRGGGDAAIYEIAAPSRWQIKEIAV